jgi:hypothetical protein
MALDAAAKIRRGIEEQTRKLFALEHVNSDTVRWLYA